MDARRELWGRGLRGKEGGGTRGKRVGRPWGLHLSRGAAAQGLCGGWRRGAAAVLTCSRGESSLAVDSRGRRLGEHRGREGKRVRASVEPNEVRGGLSAVAP